MRLNKSIKIFINYFLGPLLFIWLSYSIFQQVRHQPHLQTSWLHIKESVGGKGLLPFLLIILLMVLNWGIEALKWQLSVQYVQRISFWQAFKAVLSSVSFSVTMPNRVGEYVGRMMYMPEGKRLKIIAITMISSLSQLMATLFFGLVGFVILKPHLIKAKLITPIWYQFGVAGLLASIVILTVFYFGLPRIENWLEKLLKKNAYLYLVEAVHLFGMQRLLMLVLLSVCRYGVFALQYILAFRLFEVAVPAVTLFWVMSLVFLALAIIPSITLIEMGIRSEVSLQLVGLFTANSLGILLTSASVWFINLVIPALAGSLFILGLKLFNKRTNKRKLATKNNYADETI